MPPTPSLKPTTTTATTPPQAKLRIHRATGKDLFKILSAGRLGNVETLREMRQLVREDLQTDIGLANFAHSIVLQAKAKGDVNRRSMSEVQAIFAYVRDRIIFRRDPAGPHEAIQDARATIERGFGDCDDMSVLTVTLLGLLGHPCRFVVIRINPLVDSFQHVYCEVLDPDGVKWHALDATNSQAIIGWEHPKPLERRTFKIFGDANGEGDDLAGFMDVLKKIGKIALVAAPIALIPFTGGASALGIGAAAGVGGAAAATSGAAMAASIISAGAGAAQGIIGQIGAGKASKAQEKQVNDAFDAAVKQAVVQLQSIEDGGNVTAEQLQQAESIVKNLSDYAAQAPTKGIAQWWALPSYSTAFQTRLTRIRAAYKPSAANPLKQVSSSLNLPENVAGIPSTYLLAGGGALVLLLLLKG